MASLFQFQNGEPAAAHPGDGDAPSPLRGYMGITHLTEELLPLAGFRGAELNMLIAVKANSNSATQFMSGSILNSIFHGYKLARKCLKLILFHSYL